MEDDELRLKALEMAQTFLGTWNCNSNDKLKAARQIYEFLKGGKEPEQLPNSLARFMGRIKAVPT